MKRKRIWSMLLSVCVLMGLALPASAAGTPKVTVGEVKVDSATGNTVTVPVEITNNPGFAGIDLSISIPDGWKITDIEIRTRDAYSIFYAEDEYGDMERIVSPIVNVDNHGIGKFVAAYGSSNITGDGPLFWITYSVPANAESGLYDVEVTPVKINTLEDTTVNIADGFIFVDSTGETVKPSGGSTSGGSTSGGSTSGGSTSGGNTSGGTQKPSGTQKPTFTEQEEETPVFDDVAGNWAEEYILQAAERGIVIGDKGHYYPNDNMTRAEFVMILWRVMGSPTPAKAASFTDLTQNWYLEPIAWAQESGIVNGTSPTTFDPQGNVTREQMMTILHRLAGSPIGQEVMWASTYDQQLSDSASVSSWAKDAIYWSIFQEILCGEQSVKLGTTLAPKAAATRSQIAVSIIRYLDKH